MNKANYFLVNAFNRAIRYFFDHNFFERLVAKHESKGSFYPKKSPSIVDDRASLLSVFETHLCYGVIGRGYSNVSSLIDPIKLISRKCTYKSFIHFKFDLAAQSLAIRLSRCTAMLPIRTALEELLAKTVKITNIDKFFFNRRKVNWEEVQLP